MSRYTQEDLDDAAAEMLLRSIDYDDNNGSPDRMEFWHEFEKARDRYREIRASVKGDIGAK